MRPAASALTSSATTVLNLKLPIKTKYAGEQFDAVLLNISAGGAGVRTEKPLKSGAPVALVFAIPGSNTETPVELPGRVTWTNKSGQYGIQFAEIPPSLRTSLQRWLRAEMKKDGWDVESRKVSPQTSPPNPLKTRSSSSFDHRPCSVLPLKNSQSARRQQTSAPPSTTCNVAETQGDSI